MTLQTDFSDKNGIHIPHGEYSCNYDILEEYLRGKHLHRIIDVGAWWGPWSLYWQSRAEKIEIFEPNKKILPMLENNISKFSNCTLHKIAQGKVSMEYKLHSGTNYITKLSGDIDITTLDSFKFDNVDVIKIDVEGYEISVLEGARETVMREKPIIQIEANKLGKRYGHSKMDILKMLTGWGMKRLVKKWPDQIWAF